MKSLLRGTMLLATLSACVRSPMGQVAELQPREITVVAVTNNNFADQVVYWRKGAVDIALGVAPGLTTRRFSVPATLVGDGNEVQLAMGPRGHRPTQLSMLFDVTPRAQVIWTVDANLGSVPVVVRP